MFIQIFLRHIIFWHFVSLYLALIGIPSIFYALYRLGFQGVSFLNLSPFCDGGAMTATNDSWTW